MGFNNFLLDPDGKIRRNFIAFQQGDRTMSSFALQMSAFYLNAREQFEKSKWIWKDDFPSLV